MTQTHLPIAVLAGPTASGKSALALDIAQMLPTVIINCDSQQIYREIPIITAQPSTAEQAQVPHRLYGCISVAEHCSVAKWAALAKQEIADAHAAGKLPLLVGGTGMYIQAVIHGLSPIPEISMDTRTRVRARFEQLGNEAFYQELTACDPMMAAKLNVGDSQRIMRAMEVIEQSGVSLAHWQSVTPKSDYQPGQVQVFFLSPDRDKTYANCEKRFLGMLEKGVVEEVKALDAMHLDEALPAMKAHGVPEIRAYLKGQMTLEQASAQAILNTRHYIKRQWTWFRNQMKDAIPLDLGDDVAKQKILAYLVASGYHNSVYFK
jgi:tRNA dimethylallyltransferase